MATSAAVDNGEDSGEDLEDKDPFRELGEAQDTYPLADAPCLLLGFRWDTATKDAVCDLDAVMVFFDDNAKAMALVDCVQDTYSNVAALIDDSVYNLEGGLEDDLEKSLIDLTRVDPRVTTIVAGVRSLSMTFKAHAVSSIKCVCASLRFRRFSNGGEGGEVDLTPAWRRRVVSSTRIFGVQHETRHDQQNNVVVLFMLSRPNAASPWTVTALYDELRCRDTTALKHLMSGYVASPAISAVALKLPSIPALCAALTSKALPQMKDKFFAEGNTRGLKRHPFVHAVFMHLYQTTKGLHVKADAARVVAMLDELFDQIDINGNDYVDWEEFTSFCIELGIISGKGTNNAAFQPDDFIIDYQLVSVSGIQPPSSGGNGSSGGGGSSGGRANGNGEAEEGAATSGGMLKAQECSHGPGVAFMTYVPELKQVFYAEKGSHILKALDSTGKPHHQHEFLDPYFVEGQHVTVQTVAHIPGRYLVVFCSDHSVNLMKEVKNRRGSTHGYHCEAKVMHQLMHRKLMWEPCFQKLISIGSDNHIYQWQINDIAAGAKRIYLRPEHVNTITDIVCIPEKEIVVTSSLDRRVCVWQVPTWKLRATFRDHTLGIQALSYLRGTLLSAGFDWEIIAWDAERLERIGTMTGHKAPVTAVAQMVCPTNYEDMKAISADCNFELRVWDLSGCISGGNTIPCLMVFRLSHLASNVQMLRHISLPFDQDLSVKGYSNMLISSQHISSYAARKIKKEFFVPPAAEYNSSSAHFLCALRHNVHIWDATSGEYVRKLIDVSPSADIVSACFALPFERRLILGTEDGKLLLVNYVTGAILDEMQPHAAEVTQMAYCEATKIIISTDYRGSVVLSSEMQCKLKELRKLTDVHGSGTPITGMVYSYRLSKIVTCSGNAELQVLGFQNLDYVAAAAQGSGEPSTGLAFLDRHSIIVLGDLTRACLWHLDMETFKLTCFAKLRVPAQALGLSLDVLNSVGILRMEKTAATSPEHESYQQQRGDGAANGAKDPVASETIGDENDDPASTIEQRTTDAKEGGLSADPPASSAATEGVAAEQDCDQGEVWIALGTEAGRMACWTLEDILKSDAALMPELKLRPVPDSLCPAFRSSFNPYSEKVELKKGSQVIATACNDAAANGTIGRATAEAPAPPSPRAGRTVGGAVTTLKAVAFWKSTNVPRTTVKGVAGGPAGLEDDSSRTSATPGSEGRGGGGGTRFAAAARRLVSDGARAGDYAAADTAGGGGASVVVREETVGESSACGGRAGGSGPSMDAGVPGNGRDPRSGDITFDDEEEDCSWRVPDAAEPKAVWQGHAGSVSRIGSCSQPPCFFTLGEDGYQRIWSVEGKLLGQYALPNASDAQLKRRLFRSVGWCFLVDAVRVRPLHEEMTASLLEEVEKRRAQKTLRGSVLPDGPGSVETIPAAITATATVVPANNAFVAPRAQMSSAVGTVGTNATPGGMAMRAALAAPLAGADSRTPAAGRSHPRETSASPGISNSHGENRGAVLVSEGQGGRSSAHRDAPEGSTTTASAQDHAEVAAAARRQADAERRRAALATIENQRVFPAHAIGAPLEGKGRLEAAANPSAATMLTSAASSGARTAATCRPTSRMSAAFSAQSVRSGTILGYYGREEVDVLSAISKNPSRIAAYNRITEGKQGNQQDEPSPEIAAIPAPSPCRRRPRTTRGPVRASSSAPALLPGPLDGRSTLVDGGNTEGREDEFSTRALGSPHKTAGDKKRAAASSNSPRPEVSAQPQTSAKSRALGAGVRGELGKRAARVSEQPTPSRTVKMYRNAAREYGRGCSAGQAMWKELQRDVSAARTGSRGGRSTHGGRVGGAGKTAAAASADWASNSTSTFLELPQIETTAVSDKASWGARDDPAGGPESSESDSDPEFHAGCSEEGNGAASNGDGGGRKSSAVHRSGGKTRGATCAANDWFAATRHGRDDGLSSGTRLSLSRGPGWEDTYAFKRSASRRAIQTSGALSGKKAGTRCFSSTPSSSEKWNWDWCNRPMSALPTERVDSLLNKFDEALSSSTHVRRGPPTSTQKSSGVAVGGRGPGGARPSPAKMTTEAEAGPASYTEPGKEGSASANDAPASVAAPVAPSENNGEEIAADVSAVEDDGAGETGGTRRIGGIQDGKADSKRANRDDELAEASNNVGPEVDVVEKGRSHLVPVEVERRNKELVKLQQKIVALLVKGNDQARRREARERRRGQKIPKKPLAKGPRPGQLGPHYTLQSVLDFRAAFNFVDEDMSGCLDSEEWRRFLDRFKSTVAVINMRSMFLHLDKDMSGSVEVGELVPVIFNKASSPQHHLIRHLIEYENAMDVQRFGKSSPPTPAALQLEDAKRLFELHDTSKSGRLGQKVIRRMLLALRVPQLSWDAFARSVPGAQTAQSITADEFAAGFFEAFVM